MKEKILEWETGFPEISIKMAEQITNMLSIGKTVGFFSSLLIFLRAYGSDDGPEMSSRGHSRYEETTIRREK